MDKAQNIYAYVTQEENAFAMPITIVDGYEWSFKEHVRLTNLYKNSKYATGNSDDKPFKNIIRAILDLQYRTEGFDVKDIELHVNEARNYFKSFLVKKFHSKWARENDIDTFIDEMVESYVDYGGALVKNLNSPRPEVVPLQSIAFCDQTDMLSGPIAIKHFYSPSQLREMEDKGWGNPANGATATIEELITLSEYSKNEDKQQAKSNKTPGKYIEIYEVHGSFPTSYLDDSSTSQKQSNQIHIIGYYENENGEKEGVTLFRGKEKKLPFKLILRNKIYGRALGLGGGEELFEAQVWVNYDMIRMKGLLDVAAKVLYQTADTQFKLKNKTNRLVNGEILVHEEGKPLNQINTSPINLPAFQNAIREWEVHAQQVGGAGESTIMGTKSPTAGTPFSSLQLQNYEAHGIHEYRKGKLAVFLDEIYRDWVIPHITKELVKGQEWMSELDFEDMTKLSETLSDNSVNKEVNEMILEGKIPDPEQLEAIRNKVKTKFAKGGSKRFLKIMESELKDAPITVKVNIVGKQKDLSQVTDKLVNIFRQVLATPQVLQDPKMAKLFNSILENSGISPLDFGSVMQPAPAPQETPKQGPPLIPVNQQPVEATL